MSINWLAVFGILAAAVGIVLIEVPNLRKKGLKKERWLFSALLLLGVGISIARVLLLDVPNPYDWVTAIYKPFNDFLSAIGLIK